jgi:hypothetical protein
MSKRLLRRLADRFRSDRRPRPASRARLALESLEDRLAPAVFNVNSLADVLNPGPGITTLRSAIQAADTNGQTSNTINLTLSGTYRLTLLGTQGETDNAAGELAITAINNGSLKIINTSGGPVTVDGGGLHRVFDVNPTAANNLAFTVTFQGFTITGGHASGGDFEQGSGGGIRAQGSASVVLNSVVVTHNSATADGGGIALESINNDSTGTLTVNGGAISFNHAGDAGGGIEIDGTGQITINPGTLITENTCVNQGAGIWLDAGGANLVVTGATISFNRAITMLAGGIGNAGAGNVTIVNSLVEDNFSGGTGGGFGDAANTGNLVVKHSSFVNNVAAANGGAIQEGGPSTTITDSSFSGNVSQGNGKDVQGDGGAVFVSGMNVTIADCDFSRNGATDGGAIEDQAAALTLSSDSFEANYTVANNGNVNDMAANTPGTGGNGGAIDATTGAGTLVITNSLFVGNMSVNGGASLGGGAIFQSAGTLSVTFSEFLNNVTDFIGGAIEFIGSNATVTASTFSGNEAISGGGAVGLFAGVGANSALTNDTFVNNTAGSGGALQVGAGRVSLLNDTITGNTASMVGGGVNYLPASLGLSIQNTIIALNNNGDVLFAANSPVTDLGGNFLGDAIPNTQMFTAATDQLGTPTKMLNPLLGPLQYNGGPSVGSQGNTQLLLTEALLPGSTAINKGVFLGEPATDERGFNRPGFGMGLPSAGAFEVQPLALHDVYVLGQDGQVYDQKIDANGKAAGTLLLVAPGQVQSLAVGHTAFNQPEVFVLRPNGEIDYVASNGSYVTVGPAAVQSFVVGSDGFNDPEVFALGLRGAVAVILFNAAGVPVTGYVPALPGAVSSLAVGHDAFNRPEVFAVGMDNQVYAALFNSIGLPASGWFRVAAGPVKSIQVGHNAFNQPELFALGMDSQVYGVLFNSNGLPTTGYFLAAAGKVLSFAIGSDARNDPELFAIKSSDGQAYAATFNASGLPTSGYSLVSSGMVKSLAVGHGPGGSAELFALDANGQLLAALTNPFAPYFTVETGPVNGVVVPV